MFLSIKLLPTECESETGDFSSDEAVVDKCDTLDRSENEKYPAVKLLTDLKKFLKGERRRNEL